MRKEIQLAAEAFGIKLIRKLLCFNSITDLKERIIIHPVMDAVLLKHMLHHFPAIDVDLDEEREPGLEFDMHETEMFVQKIQVKVFAFTVDGNKFQKPIVLFLWLEGLTGFHNGEGTDEPFLHRTVLQCGQGCFFFGGLRRGKVYQGPIQGLGKGFNMGNNLLRDLRSKSRKILQQDIVFRQEMPFAGRRKELADMPLDDNPVEK